MANINTYLTKIKNAVYGRDVRDSIHDAIKAVNTESENTKEIVEDFVEGELDTTLTSTTLPAQGKAVGDAIAAETAARESAVTDLKSALNYVAEFEHTDKKPLIVDYVLGLYDATGRYSINYKWGITSNPETKLSYPYDITLECESGFAFAIQYYDTTGAYVRSDRWITTNQTIPAGTIFTICIRANPVDESVTADIDEFRQKVKVQSAIAILKDTIEFAVGIAPIRFNNDGGYIKTDGLTCDISVVISASAWKSAVIPVNPGDVFTISGEASAGGAARLWAIVQEDGTIIKRSDVESATGYVLTIPDDCAYLVLNNRATNKQTSYVGSIQTASRFTFNDSAAILGNTLLQNVIGVTAMPGNLVNIEECVNDVFIDYSNGKTHNSANYFATNYIPVTAGETYKSNVGRNWAWYASDESYLSGSAGVLIQSGITAPENAAYIRFTVNKTADKISNPFTLYFANVDDYSEQVVIPNLYVESAQNHPWCYNKKINWIGDSIVDGRDFDEEVCEALGLVKNSEYGINGSTIALNANGTDGRNALCIRYTEMSDDADIIAVSCGTNDFEYAWSPIGTIESTENTTFYGALKTLCEGLINKYPQKIIFFTTPIKRAQAFVSGAGGEYTEDGVMTTPFSKNKYGKTLGDYADIIKEVCGYYSIPVLDMYRESLLNPHLSSQQNMFDSVYTHPNTTGQKIMARRVTGWLNQLGYTIPDLT